MSAPKAIEIRGELGTMKIRFEFDGMLVHRLVSHVEEWGDTARWFVAPACFDYLRKRTPTSITPRVREALRELHNACNEAISGVAR